MVRKDNRFTRIAQHKIDAIRKAKQNGLNREHLVDSNLEMQGTNCDLRVRNYYA